MSASRYELPSAAYVPLSERGAFAPPERPRRRHDAVAPTNRPKFPAPRRQSRTKPRRSPHPDRPDALQLRYVTSVAECADAMQVLSAFKRVAVDCEGVALSRTGRLCLLQVASPHHVFVFDLVSSQPAHAENMFQQGGLKQLLENRDVYKVMHDCRNDSDALYHQFGVKLGPVIDTQVVFAVLRTVRGMPQGLPVSLKTLLKKFTSVTEQDLCMKNAIKTSMKGDDDFWYRRPLSPQALQYARLDVQHLLSITNLLSKYIHSADKNAWPLVLNQSQFYLSVFRDDEHGPKKAQRQYEQMARVARRERLAFDTVKRIEKVQAADPLRNFTFDRSLVVQVMQG
ncbi:unnamed protein product [Agarophyton chilense]|eukprot:gb/GEZJ01002383.1/.p1 GENE.gb/GEZJ01002383.1/~~gb/GEZJ01002383.1/.p1  ORF type:complete len:387 (+),score=64.54 gb/GEZJ01002383.1/:141-1163(+)